MTTWGKVSELHFSKYFYCRANTLFTLLALSPSKPSHHDILFIWFIKKYSPKENYCNFTTMAARSPRLGLSTLFQNLKFNLIFKIRLYLQEQLNGTLLDNKKLRRKAFALTRLSSLDGAAVCECFISRHSTKAAPPLWVIIAIEITAISRTFAPTWQLLSYIYCTFKSISPHKTYRVSCLLIFPLFPGIFNGILQTFSIIYWTGIVV